MVKYYCPEAENVVGSQDAVSRLASTMTGKKSDTSRSAGIYKLQQVPPR